MKQDLFSVSVYLFCNRGRKLLKAVWWVGQDKILAESKAVGERDVSLAL
jgi:hypothetical protein